MNRRKVSTWGSRNAELCPLVGSSSSVFRLLPTYRKTLGRVVGDGGAFCSATDTVASVAGQYRSLSNVQSKDVKIDFEAVERADRSGRRVAQTRCFVAVANATRALRRQRRNVLLGDCPSGLRN